MQEDAGPSGIGDGYTVYVYFSNPNKDCSLSDNLRGLLLDYATTAKMRKRDGHYPLVRYANQFINHLARKGGSARVSQKQSLIWLGYKNEDVQLKFKKIMAKIGLLRPDWELTIRVRTASALYHLTDYAKEEMASHLETKTASA